MTHVRVGDWPLSADTTAPVFCTHAPASCSPPTFSFPLRRTLLDRADVCWELVPAGALGSQLQPLPAAPAQAQLLQALAGEPANGSLFISLYLSLD